jgi:hypothetical protein
MEETVPGVALICGVCRDDGAVLLLANAVPEAETGHKPSCLLYGLSINALKLQLESLLYRYAIFLHTIKGPVGRDNGFIFELQ